jgi:hypothetical protein
MPLIYKKKDDSWVDTEINHFRLYITRNSTHNQNGYTFGLKCLVPWLTFEGIRKANPRSIILTSGTLKPLEMW